MRNPYSPPNTAGSPAHTHAKLAFWTIIAVIAIIGVASLVGREVGSQLSYGKLGGFGHFPFVWLGGFAIYPGYVLGLLLFPWGGVLNWIVASAMAAYYCATIAAAIKWRNIGIKIFVVSYLVSLGLNFFNFIFVGLLHL